MRRVVVALIVGLGLAPSPGQASLLLPVLEPGAMCGAAIVAAQSRHAMPAGLLGAIGRVESGRRDPLTGALVAWPWTIDVEGEGHFYETEAAALAAVRQFQAQGRRSIDVGCMQINLVQHPDAFASLEAAFDPASNAQYAADFLTRLRSGTADWLQAAGLYHSATPALAEAYRARITAALDGTVAPLLGQTAATPLLAMATPIAPFGSMASALHRSQGQPAPGAGPAMTTGRTLASYRLMPVRGR